jgi:hypothetical protein
LVGKPQGASFYKNYVVKVQEKSKIQQLSITKFYQRIKSLRLKAESIKIS